MLDRVLLQHDECIGKPERGARRLADCQIHVQIGACQHDDECAVRARGPIAADRIRAAARV